MTRTVANIISTAYSGSSILCVLLDSHPRIRGLGEMIHLYKAPNNAYCSACRRPAKECTLHQFVEPDRFYGSVFDYYDDCEVLVDSSKRVQTTFLAYAREPELEHHMIVLSKSPREFAYSWIHHHPSKSVASMYTTYFEFYRKQLIAIEKSGCPRTIATYREIGEHPDDALNRIFLGLNLPPWQVSAASWWETDSHIIGGNNMVAGQIGNWEGKLKWATEHQRMRYKSHHHKIFYDDAWMRDSSFVRECEGLESDLSEDQLDILKQINQPLEIATSPTVDSNDSSHDLKRKAL